jgi:K+-sensing histidine kinase KdpD
MNRNADNRYEILKLLALAGAKGGEQETTVRVALEQASALVNLSASSMTLWDDHNQVTLTVATSSDPVAETSLAELEADLFDGLRKSHRLLSAYLTFDTEPPLKSFTLPLKHGNQTFGALIGIQRGDGSLVSEDIFLEAFTAALTLKIVADRKGATPPDLDAQLSKSRQQAINETAVTVNHEINNPLTAILGNVQLLLMKSEKLDPDLKAKLGTIETAAMKIRDVTKALLSAKSGKTVEYGNGTNMIDLHSNDDTE